MKVVETLVGRFYPNYHSPKKHLRNRIEKFLQQNASVLDAGCGSGKFFCHDYKLRVRHLIGVDLGADLKANKNIDYGMLANLEHLPFQDSSFDVIFSRYVIEHLTQPQVVFQEFARILKPGGIVVVQTPNFYHYMPLIAYLTPYGFHKFISRIRGHKTQDPYPIFYRANTPNKLVSIMQKVRLNPIEILMFEGRPSYLMFSPVTFFVGVFYERIVNRFDALSRFRANIIY